MARHERRIYGTPKCLVVGDKFGKGDGSTGRVTSPRCGAPTPDLLHYSLKHGSLGRVELLAANPRAASGQPIETEDGKVVPINE